MAICTPDEPFKLIRMIFGLCNAAQTFQRMSASEFNYLEYLECIFLRLLDNGLVLSVEKCKFLQPQLRFLDYLIITLKASNQTQLKCRQFRAFHFRKQLSIWEGY